MLLLVPPFHQLDETKVETIPADFGVADVKHLDQRPAAEFAKREIERAASPIENQRKATFQPPELLLIVGTPAEVSIERGERFVNELVDVQARLQRSLAQFTASAPLHRDGYGKDGVIEGLLGISTRQSVGTEEAQNIGNDIDRRAVNA